ncbi:MAG: hypothetical protein ACFFEE_06460, partial [Candidatus Thorarchaeota archaeon]
SGIDLDEEIKKNPDDFVAYFLRGCNFSKVEKFEEYFRKSINNLPKRPAWMSGIFENGFIPSWIAKKGEEILKGAFKSRRLKDLPFDTHFNKTYVMLVQGKYEQAEKYYAEYLSPTGPRSSELHPFDAAKMSFAEIGRHNLQRAREQRQRLRLNPYDECRLKLLHAKLMVALDQYVDTVALSNQTTMLSLSLPDGFRKVCVSNTFLCRGSLDFEQNNLEGAIDTFQKFLRITNQQISKLTSDFAGKYIWGHLCLTVSMLFSGESAGVPKQCQELLKNVSELSQEKFSAKLNCVKPFVYIVNGLAELENGDDKSAIKFFTQAKQEKDLIPSNYWPQ